MLILTRKVGSKIHIGGEITVTVMEIKGKQVRLGIHAPNPAYPIHREEIFERIQAERAAESAA